MIVGARRMAGLVSATGCIAAMGLACLAAIDTPQFRGTLRSASEGAGVLLPLSQQACNTDCQRRQTDCALACDQEPACIRRCHAETVDCVRRCSVRPDGGAPAPSSEPSLPRGAVPTGPSILPTGAIQGPRSRTASADFSELRSPC